MEFDFDKFVSDIDRRENANKISKDISKSIAEEDKNRRLRSKLYHERWQNRIKWEVKNGN